MKKIVRFLGIGMMVFLLTGCSNALSEGTEHLENGEYEEAVSTFQKAAESGKNEAEAYRGLGIAYYSQKDYQNALAALEKAVKAGAQETIFLDNYIGTCKMYLEDYEQAVKAFQQGTALKKSDDLSDQEKKAVKEMQFNIVICYEKSGDWENAKKAVKTYVKAYPDDKTAEKEALFLETR